MRVSVVVCTYNRADALEITLDALRRQTYQDFEVVVVNGPSTDHTADVVAAWSGWITPVDNPLPNLSVSRNLGIRAAAGDLIAFIDDDGIPEFDWLSELVPEFEDPEVAGAGGCVFNHTGMWYQFRFSAASRIGEPLYNNVVPYDAICVPGGYRFPYLQGTNAVFRRSVLDEIGGFDETFDYYLDETDVCARIVDAGYVLRQVDGAYVHHKFLASSIRDDRRIFTRWYPVVKNLTYFGFRHALADDGEAAVLAKAHAELEYRVAETADHVAEGRLPPGSAERIRAECEEAIEVGMRLGIAAGDAPLPSMELTDQEFRPFPTIDRSDLTFVLVTQTYGAEAAGGIARFVTDTAQELGRRGHEVRVITSSPDHDRVDLEDGVWVHRLEPASPDHIDHIGHLLSFSKAVADEVQRIGTFRQVDAVYGPVWDAEILDLVRRPGPPVVAFLATPFAVVRHISGVTGALDPFESFVFDSEHEIFAGADVLHADSASVLSIVSDHYGASVDPSRVAIAHLGTPDLDHTSPGGPSTRAAAPDSVTVLYVGRLEPRKGADVLLRAVELIAPAEPQVRFVLVGADNSDVSRVRTTWSDTHAGAAWIDRVCFPGHVDPDELSSLYDSADIVVVPSLYESFGLTVVEAMRHGKALVASNVGAIPELVRHGREAVLLPPGDPVNLAVSIMALVDDAQTRAEMGAAGRSRYEQEFTIAAAVDRLERVLDRASSARTRAAS